MKPRHIISCLFVVFSLISVPVLADNFPDTTGDVIVPCSPFPHIDITSVDVTNDATTLTFQINLAGDPVATDWGKYMIGIDSGPGGDPVGDGWTRPIGMSSGMDYWVGCWADFGNGAEIRNWTGAAWALQSATYLPNPDALAVSKNASSYTVSFNYAGLGLGVGSPILFDVYSSGGGGGDGAVDAVANPNPSIANWPDYYNSGGNVYAYTLVPEPSSLGVIALLALSGLRRRRAAR